MRPRLSVHDCKRRLHNLRAELRAIRFWDIFYFESLARDEMDHKAFQAREKRREEILTEIVALCQSN